MEWCACYEISYLETIWMDFSENFVIQMCKMLVIIRVIDGYVLYERFDTLDARQGSEEQEETNEEKDHTLNEDFLLNYFSNNNNFFIILFKFFTNDFDSNRVLNTKITDKFSMFFLGFTKVVGDENNER